MLFNIILSLWLWVLIFETVFYNSFYDNPKHIWLMLNLTGMIIAVVIPRIILILLHYSGRLIRIKHGGYIKWLTNTGLIIMVLFIAVCSLGTFFGRFNFKTEYVTINIKGLNKDLDGLRIVQLSDMHLTSFYHHSKELQRVMDKVNSYKPDLLLNTGDFVSFGWREFDRNDTILNKAKSRYGNFAVMGNHDYGTYDPFFTEADRDNNVLIMNNLIRASGYKVINDEYFKINIGDAKIALIGFLYYFVPLYLKRLGALQSNIGRVLMCYGVALVFLNPVFSKLLKKTAYQKHFIALGGLLTGLAMISFQFYSGFGAILFLVVMLGLAHTLSIPSQAACIAETKIVKALGTGAGMGLFRFWERVGNVAGPLFLGCLMAWAGYDQAVVILGLMTVVCTLGFLLIMVRDKRRQKSCRH